MLEVYSVYLTKEQNKFIGNMAWKHKISKSRVGRSLIDYYIQNPAKLEELIKEWKKNEKK